MVLDKEIHRKLLLEILDRAIFKGEIVNEVYELKKAILTAEVRHLDDKKEGSVE